ncbi:hypothetical protein ABZ517_05625 [Streptomyces scabiei]|uniref:hypothetical protein n=1 Tax=Streptomyces scabiei TaxID=1930 RepID=UPI00340FD607
MSTPTTEEAGFRGREGELLTLGEWSRLFEDRDYRIVGRTEHLDAIVQTEWKGVADDVQVGVMYDTGIRWAAEWTTVWHSHWPCTEAEAKAKHTEIVALLRETCPEQPAAERRAEFQRRLHAVEKPSTALG